MEVRYIIHDSTGYREVSAEEFDAFDGEKFEAPPHWKLMLVADMLLKY